MRRDWWVIGSFNLQRICIAGNLGIRDVELGSHLLQKMWAWSPNDGEEYMSLDEAASASSSKRSVLRRAVLLLGVAACVGVVALKPQAGSAGEMLPTTILGAGTTPTPRRALSIKSKRRDESYPMLTSKLLGAYKIEILVEPHVEMHLELDGCSDDADACAGVTWSATPIEQDIVGTVDFDDSVTGPFVFMTFTGANSKFSVKAVRGDEVLAVAEASVKYVRREIYSLTDEHREKYFKAMEILFTTSQSDGEKKYGKYFFSHAEMANLHDADGAAYHDNLFFLTSHPTMQLKVERALLAIDPTVSLPYWDFLLDTKLGKDWASSKIYDESWFGPVATLESNKFHVTGRFENVKHIYDPDAVTFPNAHHDGYGFLGGEYNTNYDVHLQRSDSYCGFRSIQGQSTCGHVSTCFEGFKEDNDLYDWDICLEEKVHGNLHTMHAGQWDCSVDWQAYFSENNDWMDPLFFSILGLNAERGTEIAVKKGYATCPASSSCKVGGTCSCTSSLSNVTSVDDVDNLSYSDSFSLMQTFWKFMNEDVLQGSDWVVYRKKYHDEEQVYIPVDRQGKELDVDKLESLNKHMLKTILFMGNLGHMVSGAAADDPLFWVMHQLFDKAFQALVLSPRYNKDGFEWNNAAGKLAWNGTAGTTAFKAEAFEPWLGKTALAKATKGTGEFLTNQELWTLLHPHSDAIPYVYDQMTTWGDCSFDPFSS